LQTVRGSQKAKRYILGHLRPNELLRPSDDVELNQMTIVSQAELLAGRRDIR
jgi:hypothetical protein